MLSFPDPNLSFNNSGTTVEQLWNERDHIYVSQTTVTVARLFGFVDLRTIIR